MNPKTKKFEELTEGPITKEILDDMVKPNPSLRTWATSMGATVKDAPCSSCEPGTLIRPDGTPVPKHWTIFTVGEHVVVKDWTFRVAHINEATLILEPVEQLIKKGTAGDEPKHA